jgi:hypothetical protein
MSPVTARTDILRTVIVQTVTGIVFFVVSRRHLKFQLFVF